MYETIGNQKAKKHPTIRISHSVHGTCDVVIYNMPDKKFENFFSVLDIWASGGYDRFNDGGRYFEVPTWVYDHIDEIASIKNNGIKVIKY